MPLFILSPHLWCLPLQSLAESQNTSSLTQIGRTLFQRIRVENHLLTCRVRKFVQWLAEDSRSTTRKKRLTRDKIFSISCSAYCWQIIKCTYRIITVFCDTNTGWKALVVSSDGQSSFSPVQAVCLIEIDIFNADDLWITKSLAKIQAKTRKTLVSPFI